MASKKYRIIATINGIGIVSGCVTSGDTVRCLNCRWEATKDKNFVKKCTKHFLKTKKPILKKPKNRQKTKKNPKNNPKNRTLPLKLKIGIGFLGFFGFFWDCYPPTR